MKKRIISLILTVALMLTCAPLSGVFAAEAADAVVKVDSTTAAVGATVDVNVKISGNPGIAGATFTLAYHEDLTLLDAVSGASFAELDFTKPGTFANPCNFTWDSENTEATADGVILTLTFKVSDDAEKNSKLNVNISYRSGDIFNNEKDLVLDITNGNVIILDYIPGDLYEDGVHNSKDTRLMRQYIAGGYNITINEAAADVNDDGVINSKDTRLLRRFITGGYDVVLLPSTPKCSHIMTATAAKSETCTEDGNIAYWYCSECDKYFSDANGTAEIALEETVIEASGHTEVIDPEVEATYETTGLTQGSHCSVCLEIIVEQVIVPVKTPEYYSITYVDTKNGTSQTIKYKQHEELFIPDSSKNGYNFKGWFNNNNVKIEYIPAGNTENFTLYARWESIEYNIVYKDAPVNNNPKTYTVEQEILLSDPEWTGLIFSHWTDSNGNICTKIEKGTTGTVELFANWILAENVTVQAGENEELMVLYDDVSERYHFISKLGTIEHVVLDVVDSRYKYKNSPLSWSESKTVTIEDDIAETVSKTVAESFSSSDSLTNTAELTIKHSKSTNDSESLGASIENSGIAVSVGESLGETVTDENSWSSKTETYSHQSSSSEETLTLANTVSYRKGVSTNIQIGTEIVSGEPEGYYRNVAAGRVNVYAIVTYDPANGNYYLDTYTFMDDVVYGMIMYTPPAESGVNVVKCKPLEYNVPFEELLEYVNSSYYIKYDANYIMYDENVGSGKMPMSVIKVGEERKLLENQFSLKEYTFSGWKLNKDGTSADYSDAQVVNNLVSGGETITLYAHWTNTSGYTYISSRSDLEAINKNPSGKYRLIRDINLRDSEWTPLGTFTGELDGYNKTISNMTITSPASYSGLFSQLNDAKVQNLKLENVNITNSNLDGAYTGALAGAANNAVITNCYTSGNITTGFAPKSGPDEATLNKYFRTGQICGDSDTSLINCSSDVYIKNHAYICNEDKKIDDGGRWGNHMDQVYLNDMLGVDKARLIEQGVSEIKMTATIYSHDYGNDGYHHIYLYEGNQQDPKKEKDELYLFTNQFEDTDEWKMHSFEWNIDINRIPDNNYVKVLYGASGQYNDDWEVGDLWITVEYN